MICPVCKDAEMTYTTDPSSNDVSCPNCDHSFRLFDALNRLRSLGWKAFEIKKKKDRLRSCWVSPDGKWYNVKFGDHQIFARYVFKDLHPILEIKLTERSSDFLLKEGWIFIHHDLFSGTIVHGYKRMTYNQYRVLYDFFGDNPLFMFWTIKGLWKKSDNFKGD